MSYPKTLVLVRHAESEGNIIGVEERAQALIASHKFSLTKKGQIQAKLTGEYLKKTYGNFDKYYCSYYKRTRQTLNLMYPHINKIEDARLAEAQRGIWNTMTYEQIKIRFPEEIERRDKEDFYHYRPFGGENWPDVELRIHSFLDMLAREGNNKNILVVTHGNWLISFQKIMQSFSIETTMRIYNQGTYENASVLVYIKTKKGNLLKMTGENIVPWEGLI